MVPCNLEGDWGTSFVGALSYMETLYKTPRLHLARSGYIVFSYFSQVSDMESLKATDAALKKVAARAREAVVTVTCMSGSTVTGKVPDDVKDGGGGDLAGVEEELVANVMVVKGDGIGTTILRAFMTAFFIFSKIKRPQRCFADLDSALKWIVPRSTSVRSAISPPRRSSDSAGCLAPATRVQEWPGARGRSACGGVPARRLSW